GRSGPAGFGAPSWPAYRRSRGRPSRWRARAGRRRHLRPRPTKTSARPSTARRHTLAERSAILAIPNERFTSAAARDTRQAAGPGLHSSVVDAEEGLASASVAADRPTRRLRFRSNLATGAFWLLGSVVVALAQPGSDRKLAA